jgi:CHAD domain-containing protein
MAYRSTLVRQGPAATLDQVIATFVANLRQARHGRAGAIHDARVASRRLRELLRALAPGRAADVRSLRRDIRRLGRAMGRVREIDVSLDLMASHPLTAAWPRAVRVRIQRELAIERESRQDAMARRIEKVDLADLGTRLRALARAFAASRPKTSDAAIAARRRVRARTFQDALERAGTVYAPAPLHAVRIAAKKLRYNLEWSRATSGPALTGQLKELRETQHLLGELQDLYMLEGALRRIAAQRTLDRSTVRALQVGAVRLEAACRERHAQFVKLVPRLDALATDLARKTPLEWIRRRPARMSGPRAKAQGPGMRGVV